MDINSRRKIEEAALKLISKKAYQKAVKEYQTLLNVAPEEPRYLKQIAECYKFSNDIPNALAYYEKLAKVYQKGGLFKQSVAIYNVMVELGEERESVYDDMASCYKALNMSVDAARVYRKLLENYMIKGFFKSALSVSEKILTLNPEDTIAIINYAEACLATNDKELAIDYFKKGADIYKKQNNLNMYIKILGRIDHVTNHSDPKILNELAMLYITQKSFGPNLLEILLKSYRISKEKNDTDALIETTVLLISFFKETNQRKQMLSIMYELAKLYESIDNSKKALETYNKILQIAPGSMEVRKKAQELQDKVEAQEIAEREAKEDEWIVPNNQQQSIPIPQPITPKVEQKSSTNDAIKNSLREIDTYIKFKLFDKAEGIAKELYSKDPTDPVISKKLKEIYVKTGNLAAAIDILLKMFETSFQNNQTEAKTFLEEILYFDPDHEKAIKLIAKYYDKSVLKQEKVVEQKQIVIEESTQLSVKPTIQKDEIELINFDDDDFDQKSKSSIKDQIEQIRFYINQAMFDNAKKELDPLLKSDPNNPELLKLLSQLESAVKPIMMDDRADKKLPKSGEFQEDVNEIFEKFKEGVDQSVSKDDIKTRYDLAIAYKEMGLLDDAINEFKLVFRLTEDKIDCLVMIGLCYIDKGDFDIAIKYFKKSLEFQSIDAIQKLAIYYEIANAYDLQGNLKHAFEIFKKIVQKDKTYRDSYSRLQKIYEKLKNSTTKNDQISYV
ncbi:tetratricopeptide repeat protein [bacterium]|nr:tetratricopeptide repeat protein [bacterium]